MKRQNDCRKNTKINKRGPRADGSLLPSALRPGLFVLLGILGILIFQNSYANNVFATSLTLTIPSTLSLNISDPSANNGFNKSEPATVSVKTDAETGYTLSIKAKESSDLMNGSAKITSISSATSESDFSSGGAANTWGYIPSKLNSSDNTAIQPAPTTSQTILDKTSTANSSIANNYNFTMAVKIDSAIQAGNYASTLILTGTTNAPIYTYNITYNLNSGSWSGTSPQTGSTTATSIALDSHSPTKSGYMFRGWCNSSNIANNNSSSYPSCSGTTYNPGQYINLSISSSNNINLYAMWQSITYRSYTINYYNNVGSPSGMPSRQTGSASSTDSFRVNISSASPSLSGYYFKGWCSSSTSTESCSGESYSAGGTWTVPSDNATLDLYAKWSSCPRTVASCSSGGRSGKRFGNGKCWMSTNSRSSVYWSSDFGCPSGWRTPTKSDFDNLISSSQAGSGACLYEQGWSGSYWSSTYYGEHYGPEKYYYSFGVTSSSAGVGYATSSYRANVRCVSS